MHLVQCNRVVVVVVGADFDLVLVDPIKDVGDLLYSSSWGSRKLKVSVLSSAAPPVTVVLDDELRGEFPFVSLSFCVGFSVMVDIDPLVPPNGSLDSTSSSPDDNSVDAHDIKFGAV